MNYLDDLKTEDQATGQDLFNAIESKIAQINGMLETHASRDLTARWKNLQTLLDRALPRIVIQSGQGN